MTKLTGQRFEKRIWDAAAISDDTVDTRPLTHYIFRRLFQNLSRYVCHEAYKKLRVKTGDREEVSEPNGRRRNAMHLPPTQISQRLNKALPAIENPDLRLRGAFKRLTADFLAPFLIFFIVSSSASAKPVALTIQPEGFQTAVMERGSKLVTSQMAGSSVFMRTPEPFEGRRTTIIFTFLNNSQYPIDVGPENISSPQISVVSYDQLMEEQAGSEKWQNFFAGLSAVGNSLSALEAGRETKNTTYSGRVDCGIACGGYYNGSSISRTNDPYVAQQAQMRAAAQNRAAAEAIYAQNNIDRNEISANLRTTTVMPGHYLSGLITFEVPRNLRRAKQAMPLIIYVRLSSEVHVLNGYAGPVGSPFLSPQPPLSEKKSFSNDNVKLLVANDTNLTSEEAFNRGAAYYLGKGVTKDDAAAVSWFRKAADQGNATAQYNLGIMYRDGTGVAKDDAAAVSWYRKAADQGDANSQYNLGVMYESGTVVARDLAAAVSWFRKAAEQGDSEAQSDLGVMYESGRGVAKDDAAAVSWFRKAADQGNATAQIKLGVMYAKGTGVAKDDAAAVSWFRKAADQGNATAQFNLGIMYRDGTGVTKDDAAAVSWFRKAADQGDANAQASLGFMYKEGRGVPRDYEQAYRWLNLGASGTRDAAVKDWAIANRDFVATQISSSKAREPLLAATPRGRGNIISEDDYPFASIAAEEEGLTRVSYLIGVDGRATDCQIVKSSGFNRLDAATCSIILRRFRFNPATRNGQAVAERGSFMKRWRLNS
jgi:TonB family protein